MVFVLETLLTQGLIYVQTSILQRDYMWIHALHPKIPTNIFMQLPNGWFHPKNFGLEDEESKHFFPWALYINSRSSGCWHFFQPVSSKESCYVMTLPISKVSRIYKCKVICQCHELTGKNLVFVALPIVDRNADLWNYIPTGFQAGKLLIYIHTAKHVLVEVLFVLDENHKWPRNLNLRDSLNSIDGSPLTWATHNLKRITRHSCFLQNLRGGNVVPYGVKPSIQHNRDLQNGYKDDVFCFCSHINRQLQVHPSLRVPRTFKRFAGCHGCVSGLWDFG